MDIKTELVENPKEESKIVADSVENDPYSYLERDFSSEKFKIEIKNLPKFYGINELRKFLNEKLKLNSSKVKTPRRNSPYAFVCFRNVEDRDKALEVFKDYKWKGKQLSATKAKPAPDPLVMKRKQSAEDEVAEKKIKLDGVNSEERMKFSTIPLWNVPYAEQLKIKQADISNLLKRLGNSLYHSNADLKQWVDKQKESFNGLPCLLRDIRYSDKINGYRNKCEFTVGKDEESGLPSVGFRIGSYANGVTGVGNVDDLPHIPDNMKKTVKLFQEFVRASSLKVFDPEVQTGNFKQLTVRSTSTNQLMVIVGIHPQNLPQEELQQFKNDLVSFFESGLGKEANVSSLYYQVIKKRVAGEEPVQSEILMGDTHIYETIMGLKFRISPEAFFQVNSAGAEVLYQSAMDLAQPMEKSTVLDICCGTGTIGLCFAKKCAQVLGLEVIPQAIVDAKENAKTNCVENSEFFVGKAEDILKSVCFRARGEDIIAIVDPPRAGLHQKAIQQLRKIEKLKKLIYVSCNPNAAFKNFVDLGRPQSKTMHGGPLVPVEAVAVDMFPYTKHCELIICFQRFDAFATS